MRLFLHIADDFRALEGGKIMAVGLFADRVIILLLPMAAPDPTAEVPYGVDVSMLLTLTEVETSPTSFVAQILGPDGKTLSEVKGALPLQQTGRSANVISKIAPLPIAAEGNFRVLVTTEGGERAEEVFKVRLQRTDDPKAKFHLVERRQDGSVVSHPEGS